MVSNHSKRSLKSTTVENSDKREEGPMLEWQILRSTFHSSSLFSGCYEIDYLTGFKRDTCSRMTRYCRKQKVESCPSYSEWIVCVGGKHFTDRLLQG